MRVFSASTATGLIWCLLVFVAGPGPASGTTQRADTDAWAAAVSTPRQDSVYPQVGNPVVDALHYDLDLSYDRTTLTGTATILFRAAQGATSWELDLARSMKVSEVLLDHEPVAFSRQGHNLIVAAPVETDSRHTVEVTYAGRPTPVKAPTDREDFTGLGLTRTASGELWTMQEPYGAFTWYPVNDQPADKAYYDFTITAPKGWVGVANGALVDRTKRTTSFHLDEPASSYLTTLAIGDYTMTTDDRGSVPITYWTQSGKNRQIKKLRHTPAALAWAEDKLGSFPFDSLSIVVVDSESAMETQSTMTFGTTDYVLDRTTIAHELVHQWYGDLVSPDDWRDVWMNEGMTTYLQYLYEDHLAGVDEGSNLMLSDDIRDAFEPGMRAEYGPPGAYDPARFAQDNVYLVPAWMWKQVHTTLGEQTFWEMARNWPNDHARTSSNRETLAAWWTDESGVDLDGMFAQWLTGAATSMCVNLADARQVEPGDQITVIGRLAAGGSCNGPDATPIPQAELVVERSGLHNEQWIPVATVTTNSSGKVRYDLVADRSMKLRLSYAGSADQRGAQQSVEIVAKQTTSLRVPAAAVRTKPGRPVTLRARLTSDGTALAGERVLLLDTRNWTTRVRRTDSNGRVRATPRVSQNTRFVWYFNGDAAHHATSAPVRVKVGR